MYLRAKFGLSSFETYYTWLYVRNGLSVRNGNIKGCIPRRSFSLRSFRGPDAVEYPRLTPQLVTTILRHQDNGVYEKYGAVKGFETNQLPSNNPIEDRRAEAKLVHNIKEASHLERFLFGVFDGHAGCACAQAVSERLFNYIGVSLSTPDILQKIRDGQLDLQNQLVSFYRRDGFDYTNNELTDKFQKSLEKFASETLAAYNEDYTVAENIYNAFVRLDEDISTEALPHSQLDFESLQCAFSGAVASVAFLDGVDLYVANVGDSKAVLGVNSQEDRWETVEMSHDHNAENEKEVLRLYKNHPNESANIVKNGRLFGDLAPLRAFGDVRYKWPAKDLKHIVNTVRHPHSFISMYGNRLIPRNYQTPPYLSAEPEIIHRRLTPKDKFLIIASDGLWDNLSPEKVVKLVAGHLDGQQVLVNFQLPREDVTLKEINELLIRRKTSLAQKIVDTNVATHLIRNAIGPEHGQLSAQLTLPDSIVRFYRDDITVTVVYFDTDYIIEKLKTQ